MKLLFVLLLLYTNSSYSQNIDENKSLFKLGSNPFISKAKLNLNLSYGVNYGSPSFLIQQWFLPNDKKQTMFKNIIGSVSVANEVEAYTKYIEGYSLGYNYLHTGVDYKKYNYVYGIKLKIIDSDGFIPDGSIEVNSEYPLSLAIGSSDEKLKYYACIDFGFYYIFFPYRYSVGFAYSFVDFFTIFAEGNYQASGNLYTATQSARTGIDVSLFNYIHLDVALFYFGFNFTAIIPGRNGLTWKDPDYIMTMPEKNNYFLLSSSIYINLDLLK